jgi:hypothetical protein
MSTGTTIIQSALKEIGAHSIAAPSDPESIEIGMKSLNSMLQLWLSQDIDLGVVPLSAPGDELGEPADSTQVIIDCLAIILGPNFDNGGPVVSGELKNSSRRGYNRLKGLYQKLTIPNKAVSSTLPRGAGNRRYLDAPVFSAKGATVDG